MTFLPFPAFLFCLKLFQFIKYISLMFFTPLVLRFKNATGVLAARRGSARAAVSKVDKIHIRASAIRRRHITITVKLYLI